MINKILNYVVHVACMIPFSQVFCKSTTFLAVFNILADLIYINVNIYACSAGLSAPSIAPGSLSLMEMRLFSHKGLV